MHPSFASRPWRALAAAIGLTACSSGEVTGVPTDGARGDVPDAGSTTAAMCVAGCPIWSTRCDDRCVDLAVAVTDCGACGAACNPHTQVCANGVCVAAPGRCTALTAPTGTDGLRAEYYAAPDLTNLKRVRIDPAVDFDWSAAPPDAEIPREQFSVRWRGTVTPLYSEPYTFTVRADDGTRVFVDDVAVIDDWTAHATMEHTGTVALRAGTAHALRVEYFQATQAAVVKLSWSSPRQASEVIPRARLAPARDAVFACATGSCCPTGGATPLCCPAGNRCVVRDGVGTCCPPNSDCEALRICGTG